MVVSRLCCDIILKTCIDFSFSRGLVRRTKGTTASRVIVATSYDSDAAITSKYPETAPTNVAELKAQKNVKVFHNVDGTRLSDWMNSIQQEHDIPRLFDKIIFNFPHSGAQRVHTNRQLLLDFFTSARDLVVKRGEIHVSLKTRPPYSNWEIESQATAADLVIKDRAPFDMRHFPGYKHQTTDPDAKAFEPKNCRVYQFVVNRQKVPVVKKGKKRKISQNNGPLKRDRLYF